ncbi:DEAD/DEAH box helicase [Bacillus aquiflavi]|uniref:DEAD/DEAH box helicase n=1 Tax=Bacillus aquiflavi TaxID=2672567 RepID=UPI001CA7F220|nr:DEAD/DEAH box helicase [Bacillus aquiflavi]UAC48741.1 DEAD/DEAH box helicase [Bacillus aquiflavi]
MGNKSSILTTLKPFLQNNWGKSRYSHLTPVQMKAIPLILEGKNLTVQSPTGTGKTIAYLLPIIQKMDKQKKQAQAVIIAPSRELVMQIHEESQKWLEGSDLSAASFIGGANVKRQIEKLKKHPQLIVGTPGRILELIKLKKLKMHEVQTIVLDESDQLLVPEHEETIKNIIKSTMSERQVLLFSATRLENKEKIENDLGKEVQLLKIGKEEMPASNVAHYYFVYRHREKEKLLEKILKTVRPERALAFVQDIGNMSVIAAKLKYEGVALNVLHSELKKEERKHSLNQLRIGKNSLLLATDVATRGLDIKDLTHVIHVDFPENIKQYVHRSGRTGRMGASGIVITLVTEREERTLRKYGRELGIKMQRKSIYKGKLVDFAPRA